MAARDTSGLALGTQARSDRARLRRMIAAGDVGVISLLRANCLEDDERIALGMRLAELLEASPRARDRIVAIAVEARVENINVRLRELTMAERSRIATAIDRGGTT